MGNRADPCSEHPQIDIVDTHSRTDTHMQAYSRVEQYCCYQSNNHTVPSISSSLSWARPWDQSSPDDAHTAAVRTLPCLWLAVLQSWELKYENQRAFQSAGRRPLERSFSCRPSQHSGPASQGSLKRPATMTPGRFKECTLVVHGIDGRYSYLTSPLCSS